jgi:hypothetical protein
MPDPRYPVGQFEMEPSPTPARRAEWIEEIAQLPAKVRAVVASLPEGTLDRPYREGGWTGRQVVHHLVDSHINSYVRFRLALTETDPVIKPYDEARWAELTDAKLSPVAVSLDLLEALHERWVTLLRSLNEQQWNRKFFHPQMGERNLITTLALYAWHGRHHAAHLELLR